MTSYRRTELALSFFIFALGVATVVLAYYTIDELSVLRDRIGARGFAYVIGTLVALGGAILLVTQLRAAAKAPALVAGTIDPRELGGDEPDHPASAWRAFAVVGALILYAALMRPAGYIIASALFVSSGTAIMGGRGLMRLLIYPILYAISTYLLFDTLLGVRIPDGILRPLIVAIGLG